MYSLCLMPMIEVLKYYPDSRKSKLDGINKMSKQGRKWVLVQPNCDKI